MNEQQIQEQLRQNIPETEHFVAPTPQPVVPSSDRPSESVSIELDELATFKLHDLFGKTYHSNDAETKQQLNYIYSNISEMVGSTEYGFVANKIRELESMLGITEQNRVARLYKWLKLNSMSRNIDYEMRSLNNGVY